jgi:hypothetical protein
MGASWIGVLLPVSLWLTALTPAAQPYKTLLRASCRDAPDCNFEGTRELSAGRMAAAAAAFEKEACFAWREGEMAPTVRAHNNLALLALRRGEPLQARLWAGLALKFDPRSRAARHNARLADEAVARLPPGQGVTGTYWHRWGDSLGHEVDMEELPGNRIRFELHAVKMTGTGPCHAPNFNLGGADGYATFNGGVAVWETREWGETCRLRFSFRPDELTIDQDGADIDCGFGGGVHADGTYLRTSRQPPRFTVPAVTTTLPLPVPMCHNW